jgi:AcrR family transcriptional regulator
MTPSEIQVQDKTRQRLLEAAGEVFAEHGFHAATVRQICDRAGGANVSAVKYHFGDKQALYGAALRYAHGCAIAKYPPSMGLPPDAPAGRRLHAFVLSFLMRVLDDGRPAWHAKIMSREMADPTDAMDELVHQQIKPHFMHLRQAVADLFAPKSVDDETLRFCCNSVVGQCLFYHFGRPVSERLFPGKGHTVKDAERIAGQITRLTLAGVRALARERGPRAGRLNGDDRGRGNGGAK